MEHPIFPCGEHQPAAIGRHPGEGGTHIHRCRIEHELAFSEGHGIGVERFLVDIVFHLLAPFDDILPMVDARFVFEVGTAIVQRLAIGSPGREHLQLRGIVLQVRHLVPCHVVGDEVALRIKHLDLVRIRHLEDLTRLVRGIDDEVKPGMPGGIDTCREDGVVAHIDLPYLSVVGHHRTSQVLTCMELHACGVILLVVMTVDALSFALPFLAAQDIVVDHTLIVGLQTALTDGQFLVADIRGVDETVAEVGIDAVLGHIDIEGFVFRPLSVVTREHLHPDLLVGSLRHEALPIITVGLYLVTFEQQLLTVGGEPCHHAFSLLCHLERQRRHIHRHRHALVIRVDVWLRIRRCVVLRHLRGAGCHQCHQRQ